MLLRKLSNRERKPETERKKTSSIMVGLEDGELRQATVKFRLIESRDLNIGVCEGNSSLYCSSYS